MAGVGVKLNQIFDKESLVTHIYGFGYSMVITVAPMFVVIGAILAAELFLGFSQVDYYRRELFADTVLYIFIFSLLCASPFNAALSRYLSDVIFRERYQDILPCYYVGLALNVGLGFLTAVPFCVHEYLVGHIPLYYVCTGFCGFMALLLVFYSMLYLSITKDYGKISLNFIIGMLITFILAAVFHVLLEMELTYSILLALVIGFLLVAALEIAIIQSYFRQNSREYRAVFSYFRTYWQLILINFLYTLGLYIHNFVFWATPMHTVLARSFVTMMSYDMATCLAMFTNISATVIFISRMEMHFHDRYKAFSEAVIGGRGQDIRNTRQRMFRQLAEELMSLVRIQFIITVAVFFLCVIFLPRLGFGGSTLRIYPCLCVGYFMLFLMYAEILFLYYFNELTGALWTAALFCIVTCLGSVLSSRLTDSWYGLGLLAGGLCGFTTGYFRLHRIEKVLDVHVFCGGSLMRRGEGKRPPGKVFDRAELASGQEGKGGRRRASAGKENKR